MIRYITLFRFLGGRCGPTQPSLFGHGDSYVVYYGVSRRCGDGNGVGLEVSSVDRSPVNNSDRTRPKKRKTLNDR